MNALQIFLLTICWMIPASCSEQDPMDTTNVVPDPVLEEPEMISDDELMTLVQEETFNYFWDFAQADSGCARERYHVDNPSYDANTVAVGGTGFGIMGIIVGIERGFITRTEGMQRFTQILDFLQSADRFHGAWPHWLDGTTGRVRPFSPKDNGGDLVETAFLCQGLICLKEYLKNGSAQEQLLADQADQLWKGVEWNWYTQNQKVLYWHWSPTFQFDINLPLKGYNEVLIAYVLAAASPEFAIDKETFIKGWASDGNMVSSLSQYGIPLLVRHAGAPALGGPLFWAHYSYLGLNPMGLTDEFVNYWEVNVNHSRINHQYCVRNPRGYRDYGLECWGLTASYSRNDDGSIGYNAHHPGNDTGVISPTAAISSIPYTPTESLAAMRHFYDRKAELLGPAGFYDAFSPQYSWVAKAYLAIDQGPQIIMIENYRTGLLWQLFMANEDVQNGLTTLNFNYQQ